MSPKEIAMTTAIVEYDFKPLARIGSPENMRDMMRSERMQNALRDILPKFSDEPDPDKHIARLVAQAGIAFMNTPRLADCTQISIFEAMMNVASTGLSLARQAGEAYLIPFRDNRKGVTNAQFMPGYRGLIRLAHQTAAVRSVDVVSVFADEQFEYEERADGPHLLHVPDFDADRVDKDIRYVYCRILMFPGGSKVIVMNRKEIEKIRSTSKQKDGDPWRYHWGEMAKKTVIKRALKTLPQSISDKTGAMLARAVELDNRAAGFDFDSDELKEYKVEQQKQLDAEWKERMEADKDAVDALPDLKAGIDALVSDVAAKLKTDTDGAKAVIDGMAKKKLGAPEITTQDSLTLVREAWEAE